MPKGPILKIFITGGAGLIGSHVAALLVKAGHTVMAFDDLSFSYTARAHAMHRANLDVRLDTLLQGAEVITGSTLDKARLRDLIFDQKPDVVLHLAAIPLVAVATAQVEFAFRSLSQGLVNVLEVLRDAPFVQRFVYASSSMVYGTFVMDPMPEDGPKTPINIYGGLKLAGEVLTRAYLHPTDIEHVIVRPSAVYGPTDQHYRVVQKFCEGAMTGEPLLIQPANDHIMDFTYVDDIAKGFTLAVTEPGAANETFNITFGQARRLSELVAILRQYYPALATSAEPINDADRPTRGSLSIEKAQRLLGYAPQWPLERGVPAYLSYLRGDAASRQRASA